MLFLPDFVYVVLTYSPHSAENARILRLSDLGIQELLAPGPAEPRPGLDPQGYFKYNSVSSTHGLDSPYSAREEMLSNSKLNKRKPVPDPNLSPNSILNIRYEARIYHRTVCRNTP